MSEKPPSQADAAPLTSIENAMRRMVNAALVIWTNDPHKFSSRPCATCRAITALLDEAWGCIELEQGVRKRAPTKTFPPPPTETP